MTRMEWVPVSQEGDYHGVLCVVVARNFTIPLVLSVRALIVSTVDIVYAAAHASVCTVQSQVLRPFPTIYCTCMYVRRNVGCESETRYSTGVHPVPFRQ